MIEGIITAEELSKRWGVHVRTIYRRLQSGELTGRKIGNNWLFAEKDITDLPARRRAPKQKKSA